GARAARCPDLPRRAVRAAAAGHTHDREQPETPGAVPRMRGPRECHRVPPAARRTRSVSARCHLHVNARIALAQRGNTGFTTLTQLQPGGVYGRSFFDSYESFS